MTTSVSPDLGQKFKHVRLIETDVTSGWFPSYTVFNPSPTNVPLPTDPNYCRLMQTFSDRESGLTWVNDHIAISHLIRTQNYLPHNRAARQGCNNKKVSCVKSEYILYTVGHWITAKRLHFEIIAHTVDVDANLWVVIVLHQLSDWWRLTHISFIHLLYFWSIVNRIELASRSHNI